MSPFQSSLLIPGRMNRPQVTISVTPNAVSTAISVGGFFPNRPGVLVVIAAPMMRASTRLSATAPSHGKALIDSETRTGSSSSLILRWSTSTAPSSVIDSGTISFSPCRTTSATSIGGRFVPNCSPFSTLAMIVLPLLCGSEQRN
jgi:hypothetical protein